MVSTHRDGRQDLLGIFFIGDNGVQASEWNECVYVRMYVCMYVKNERYLESEKALLNLMN